MEKLREGWHLDSYLACVTDSIVVPFKDMATDGETSFQEDVMSSV